MRWVLVPWLCVVCSAGFAIAALAVSSLEPRILLAVVAVFFALGAWANFSRRYELRPGELLVSSGVRRRTVDLTDLAAADAVRMTASGGRVFWHLMLTDRQGTRVRLTFQNTHPDQRRRFLTALTPYLMAADVNLSGPIDEALLGRLW